MDMSKKHGVKKLYKDSCPNCGHRNTQIIQGNYPEFDQRHDTITKFFICERCLTEYYEKYRLEYDGYEALELMDEDNDRIRYEKVCYDADGNRIN